MFRLYFILAVFLLSVFPLSTSAEVNLALHKSYTLSPKPNYALCSDKFDLVQLTDGQKKGSNWTRKSTVGWRVYNKIIPEVIIDLGSKSYIDNVKVHSVGGGAGGVHQPDFVIVLLSDNGINFEYAGVATTQTQSQVGNQRRRIPYIFTIRGLKINARFIKVVLQPGSVYAFLDEIEVFGSHAPIAGEATSIKHLPSFKDQSVVFSVAEIQIQLADALNILKNAILRLYSVPMSEREKIQKGIELLQEQAFGGSDKSHSVAELKSFFDELDLIRADMYRAIYNKPYVCISSDPFDTLYENMMAVDGEPAKKLDLKMWQNEFEVAAVNIINCSQESLIIRASVSPVTGITSDTQLRFDIRRGIYVNARGKGRIADALVLQQERPFTLAPGGKIQLWIEFNSSGLDAGSYTASFAIFASSVSGDKLASTIIPVDIEIVDLRFPDDIRLDVCNWAYPLRSSITRGAISETAVDLKKHYTNVFVIPPSDLPLPKANSGLYQGLADQLYLQSDMLIKENDYAKTYLFFLGFKPDRKDSGRFGKWMSPGWKSFFRVWLKQWIEHLKQNGIGYERFALYPFDEKLGDEFYQFAQEVKRIDSNVQIYANSFGKGPDDFMRFRNLVDIWCFSLSDCQQHTSWLNTVKGFGNKVWLYDAKGPGKANDPYSYYRLMSWWAFRYELSGVGFWVYADPFAKSIPWHDTNSALGYFGVVYSHKTSSFDTGGEKIIPSKRWEAWREGVEDYIYLTELQEAIKAVKHKNSTKAEQAQCLLAEQLNIVLKNTGDSRRVDQAREKVSNALIGLRRSSTDISAL